METIPSLIISLDAIFVKTDGYILLCCQQRKVASRLTTNSHSPVSGSPKLAGSFLSENPAVSRTGIASGLHMTQPWFHSGITREEAVNLISKQGLVDGYVIMNVTMMTTSATLFWCFLAFIKFGHKQLGCMRFRTEVI